MSYINENEELEKWVENCPEHDTEILHTDEDGIVLVVRFNNKNKNGLGLGIFISKTLLERTNAKVLFKQKSELGGAFVSVAWKESDLENI